MQEKSSVHRSRIGETTGGKIKKREETKSSEGVDMVRGRRKRTKRKHHGGCESWEEEDKE